MKKIESKIAELLSGQPVLYCADLEPAGFKVNEKVVTILKSDYEDLITDAGWGDEKEAEPTKDDIDMMRHACGMDSKTPHYRNFYDASPGSKDNRIWRRLVSMGLAVITREPYPPFPDSRIYGVTEKGKKYLNE